MVIVDRSGKSCQRFGIWYLNKRAVVMICYSDSGLGWNRRSGQHHVHNVRRANFLHGKIQTEAVVPLWSKELELGDI